MPGSTCSVSASIAARTRFGPQARIRARSGGLHITPSFSPICIWAKTKRRSRPGRGQWHERASPSGGRLPRAPSLARFQAEGLPLVSPRFRRVPGGCRGLDGDRGAGHGLSGRRPTAARRDYRGRCGTDEAAVCRRRPRGCAGSRARGAGPAGRAAGRAGRRLDLGRRGGRHGTSGRESARPAAGTAVANFSPQAMAAAAGFPGGRTRPGPAPEAPWSSRARPRPA